MIGPRKSGNVSWPVPASPSSILFGAVLLVAAAGGNASGQERFYGTSSRTYNEQKSADALRSVSQDSLNVNYDSPLTPDWQTAFFGHFAQSQDSLLKYPSRRPLYGASLSSSEIRLDTTYTTTDDRNYKGATGTLSNENLTASLALRFPHLPAVQTGIVSTRAFDDLNPREVDTERFSRSFQLSDRYWDELNLAYIYGDSQDITRRSGSASGLLPGQLPFQQPNFVAVDSFGAVYVVDAGRRRVLKFNNTGTLILDWGASGSGPGQFTTPAGIAVDAGGNVYVADSALARVQKFDTNGSFLAQWGTPGAANGQFNLPIGVAVDATGVYVVDSNNARVQKFTPAGAFLLAWGTAGIGPGQFLAPQGVATDGASVYVTDTNNHRVERFTTAGAFVSTWGAFGSANSLFASPTGIATDGAAVYVADTGNNRIQRFSTAGLYLSQWGTAGTTPGQFNTPIGIAADTASNLFVVDSGNLRVQRFLATGTLVTTWGNTPGGTATTTAATKFQRNSWSDSFGGIWTHSFRNVITVTSGFGLDRSGTTDLPSGNESESRRTWATPTLAIRLLRDLGLSYAWDLQHQSTAPPDTQTSRRTANQNLSFMATPFTDVTAVAAYATTSQHESRTPEQRTWGPSVSVALKPRAFIQLNTGWSKSSSQVGNRPVHTATAFTINSNVAIRQSNAATLTYAHGTSQDPESQTEATTDSTGLELFLIPIEPVSVNTRTRYTLAVATGKTASRLQSWSHTGNATWTVGNGFSLTAGVTYDLTIPDGGLQHSVLGLQSGANYSWDRHAVSVIYTMNQAQTISHIVRAEGRFGLSERATFGVSSQWTVAGEGAGDRSLRADLTISF